MDRRDKMLEGIDLRRSRGVEIGALAFPLVTKAESDIRYVDWADQKTLQAKYAGDPNVDCARIVPVDAIWGDNTLAEAFSGETGFDYVIASHVIEHVPDMIGWLQEIAEVLRPGGRLALAIPDARFTFDFLRSPSRVGDFLNAYLRHDRRPSPGLVYDFHASSVVVDAAAAWNGALDPNTLPHYTDPRSALTLAREAAAGAYQDVHCWVFTPSALMRVLIELVDLRLLPYRCARFHDTEHGGVEMILVLERLPDTSDEQLSAARASFQAELDRLQQAAPADGPQGNAAHLHAVIDGLQQELATLRASMSWRITEPLRTIRSRMGSA